MKTYNKPIVELTQLDLTHGLCEGQVQTSSQNVQGDGGSGTLPVPARRLYV